MADLSQLNVGDTLYDLKDKTSRTDINGIKNGQEINSFADVESALSGKTDNDDVVASAFSAAETYAEGDYCTYEGSLYKFKTAHEGAWDAADVDRIKIAGELSELKNTLSGIRRINWFSFTVPSGSTTYDFSTNKPSDFYGIICAISISGGGATIIQCTNTHIFFDAALSSASAIRITYIVK